jgi:hypothetical protein
LFVLGIFSNFTTNYAAITFGNDEGSSYYCLIINCSFVNIASASVSYAACIHFYSSRISVNINNSFFKNISCPNVNTEGGAVDCYMSSSSSLNYDFSGNVFVDINSGKSAVLLYGTFNNLTFSNNTFINITSTTYGGVCFF